MLELSAGDYSAQFLIMVSFFQSWAWGMWQPTIFVVFLWVPSQNKMSGSAVHPWKLPCPWINICLYRVEPRRYGRTGSGMMNILLLGSPCDEDSHVRLDSSPPQPFFQKWDPSCSWSSRPFAKKCGQKIQSADLDFLLSRALQLKKHALSVFESVGSKAHLKVNQKTVCNWRVRERTKLKMCSHHESTSNSIQPLSVAEISWWLKIRTTNLSRLFCQMTYFPSSANAPECVLGVSPKTRRQLWDDISRRVFLQQMYNFWEKVVPFCHIFSTQIHRGNGQSHLTCTFFVHFVAWCVPRIRSHLPHEVSSPLIHVIPPWSRQNDISPPWWGHCRLFSSHQNDISPPWWGHCKLFSSHQNDITPPWWGHCWLVSSPLIHIIPP